MALECVRCVLRCVTRAMSSATPSVAPSSVTVVPRRTRVVKLSSKEVPALLQVAVKQQVLQRTVNHLLYHLDHPPQRRQRKVIYNFFVCLSVCLFVSLSCVICVSSSGHVMAEACEPHRYIKTWWFLVPHVCHHHYLCWSRSHQTLY